MARWSKYQGRRRQRRRRRKLFDIGLSFDDNLEELVADEELEADEELAELEDLAMGAFGGQIGWQGPPRDSREAWRRMLDAIDQSAGLPQVRKRAEPPVAPYYILDVETTRYSGNVQMELCRRTLRKDGKLGAYKTLRIDGSTLQRVTDENDRYLLVSLMGGGSSLSSNYGGYYRFPLYSGRHEVPPEALRAMLPQLVQTGRFEYRTVAQADPRPLVRDAGPPWEAAVQLQQSDAGAYTLSVRLMRDGASRPLSDADLLIDGAPGFCLIDGVLYDLDTFGCNVGLLRANGQSPATIPAKQVKKVVHRLMTMTCAPRLELPEPWTVAAVRDQRPTGQLEVTIDAGIIDAELSYRYGDTVVPGLRGGASVIVAKERRQLFRDAAAEAGLADRLVDLGFREETWEKRWRLPLKRLPEVVRTLSEEGWTILADGRVFRRPGEIDIEVTSGIDWFDVDGKVDFEGAAVALPELLKAVRSGKQYVQLSDGSLGMLPEAWLARHGVLLELGREEGDKLRFHKTQVLLIDELLAQQPRVRIDEAFAEMRAKLRAFEGVQPRPAPAEFVGQLRPYQEHGLGWIGFLDEFAWGGCLADDMGLGKTVQVLAWLAGRKRRLGSPPSLIVVPRSVVFNWVEEARRFTPQLKVLVYHGSERRQRLPDLGQYDVLLTTYHTLRIDIADIMQREFDYVILDEAQAVKNARAQAAKAVRLLKGRRRLALTGTPVENRLADLWSLFDFLNPGMLGAVGAFDTTFTGNGDGAGQRIESLRRGLRPFILRRTKEAVAPELPSKTEETLLCDMTSDQAKRYDELRQYYRAAVLGKVDEVGLAKSKIHVLEALLRLRQAACHPALLDKQIDAHQSGKMGALMPMLAEVLDGGHKALVFSQFTSFLSILQKLLKKEKITYEYLDGKTTDRQARVERFQSDPACRLFLISLKAGGLGLNLTAADYVFILDPWWNPAVEAQAIDRAHRIGQDKKVFAYRIIARGTVEEKILELQGKKRDLAAAIITEANSLISELTREDLEVLLS